MEQFSVFHSLFNQNYSSPSNSFQSYKNSKQIDFAENSFEVILLYKKRKEKECGFTFSTERPPKLGSKCSLVIVLVLSP